MPKPLQDVRLPAAPPTDGWARELVRYLTRFLQPMVDQLAAVSEGRAVAHYQALSSVPTGGTYAQDDIVWKSGVSEQGSAGSKYVVIGWVCVASGTPGTWKELRCLTGN